MDEWPTQRVAEVADGVVAILHGQGEMGVANSAFIIDSAEAVVIDTMTLPRMAVGIAQEIARRHARVSSVINTHHHIDHIGGNQVFAGARFYAHPNTMRTMEHSDYSSQACDRLIPRFRGYFDGSLMVFPQEPIDPIALPQDALALAFTPAHTPADVAVWLPDSRVLLAGDLSFVGVTPLVVHGLVSGWIEALDRLIALRPAVVVPGHGPIGGLQALVTVRTYLAALQEMGQRAVTDGVSLADAVDAFDAGPVAEWLDPGRAAINMDRAMQEARGQISRTELSILPSGCSAPLSHYGG